MTTEHFFAGDCDGSVIGMRLEEGEGQTDEQRERLRTTLALDVPCPLVAGHSHWLPRVSAEEYERVAGDD